MPKTFELKFTKIADNLYSGYLSVEGRQMTFGVPKTKEEIYQFLFGGNTAPPPPTPEITSASGPSPASLPVSTPLQNPVENEGWRYVPSENATL